MIDAHALGRAGRIAEAVLLPAAGRIDAADAVPHSVFALLADDGLERRLEPDTRFAVTETLAGSSLSVAMVWLQHQGALGILKRWGAPTADLERGARRAGIAITALRGPTPLRLAGGRLTGRVPWITGWGRIDVVVAAALGDDGLVHHVLVDAVSADTLRVERTALIAAHASDTVTATFGDHRIRAHLGAAPVDEVAAADAAGLGGNGALAVGVAARALAVAGPSGLDAELAAARAALRAATVEQLPAARAAASALAMRAASLAVARAGAGTVVVGGAAARLTREAAFTAVFGSRPAIAAELVERLQL